MAQPTGGGATPAFEWLVNGIASATGDHLYYTPLNGDKVVATMISAATCAQPAVVTDSLTMTVDSTVVPVVSITHPGTLQPGQAITFTALATNGITSPAYQWLINATYIAGATSATFISPPLNYGDTVLCIVTNNGRCGATWGRGYVVLPGYTGVHQIAGMSSINIFPNPNKGLFTIRGIINGAQAACSVTDIWGRTIYAGDLPVTQGVIDCPVKLNAPAGTYTLTISAGGAVANYRLVIQ